MVKISGILKSRIGTCRTGKPFDVPYKLGGDQDIETILDLFTEDELVDVFCMCEAKLVQIAQQSLLQGSDESVVAIGDYFWSEDKFKFVEQPLLRLDLKVSPDYVRFGMALLLA